MSRSPVALIAIAAFLIPIAAVLYQRRDQIAELNRIDPTDGYVIFFTSPG